MQLNEKQEEAAKHIYGPCLVTACPGSGKTAVLTERTARLIEQGVPQNNILSLTFTNKAGNEMKQRIADRLGVKKVSSFIGTFHSFCATMLRRFASHAGYNKNFTILDADEQVDLINQIARQNNYIIEKSEIKKIAYNVNHGREYLLDRDEYEKLFDDDLSLGLADEYLERIKSENVVDFSGLLYESLFVLENNPELRQKIQERMKFIQVDETQDTNYIQLKLINTLGDYHKNIYLIGDTAQAIYSFRGARYQNIADFLELHPDCRQIELPLNYRSTPQIINVANQLIKTSNSFMNEKFEANKGDGEDVHCFAFEDQLKEAEFVAKYTDKLIREGGWSPSDIAVLYRTNAMSEPLEREFVKNNVQYQIIGGRSFYDRKEIKDMLSMLRLASNPFDGIAFHRVTQILPGMGDKTVGRIERRAKENEVSLISACKNIESEVSSKKVADSCRRLCSIFEDLPEENNAAQYLKTLFDKMHYADYLTKYYEEDAQDRINNVTELINSAANYAEEVGDARAEKFLQNISLMTTKDNENDDGSVSMMTLHGCKGLEFPVVFIVGVEQGILPHKMSLEDDPWEGEDEERRLFYVGLTRAEDLLYVSYCRNRRIFSKRSPGGSFPKRSQASQFLKESGLLKDKTNVKNLGSG